MFVNPISETLFQMLNNKICYFDLILSSSVKVKAKTILTIIILIYRNFIVTDTYIDKKNDKFARVLDQISSGKDFNSLMVFLSKIVFGDLTKYGIRRPNKGPIYMKRHHGKYPIIDVGTFNKIKSGHSFDNHFVPYFCH